jgi:N6-adenosine-specific RNA methylase IME4
MTVAEAFASYAQGRQFGTILVDPPWRFTNRTGKMAPEHRRLSRYMTLSTDEIASIPVSQVAAPVSHLYLWVPNALLAMTSSHSLGHAVFRTPAALRHSCTR